MQISECVVECSREKADDAALLTDFSSLNLTESGTAPQSRALETKHTKPTQTELRLRAELQKAEKMIAEKQEAMDHAKVALDHAKETITEQQEALNHAMRNGVLRDTELQEKIEQLNP